MNRVTARAAAVRFAVEMRALCCALALAVLPGCGEEEDHVNRERPASSINVTAAIIDGRVLVSPERFGAGPIRLIVTNETQSAQALTFQTDEIGGDKPGITRKTAPINPSGTATLEVDVRRGDYAVSTDDGKIEPVTVKVGAPRPSAQDELLLPYVDRYLATAEDVSALRGVWADRGAALRKNVLRWLFPWPLDKQAFLDRLDPWLAAAPLSDAARRIIAERRDDLVRALRCQTGR